jgi:IS30 family transposase
LDVAPCSKLVARRIRHAARVTGHRYRRSLGNVRALALASKVHRLAGTATTYIEPGSPWENPFVESFNGRVRDELLNTEEFATLLEAQILAEA